MNEKFRRSVASEIRTFLRPPWPVWISPDYWLDRLEAHAQDRAPNRRVRRSRLVRMVRAALGQFGPTGWIWFAVTVLLTAGLVRGWSWINLLATLAVCLCWAHVGRLWATRNDVVEWGISVECECGRELSEDDLA
jgi:hypothetical protein